MKAIAVLAFVVAYSAAAAQQSTESFATSVIYGTVIDRDGQPAKELGLMAYPLGMALGAMLPYTKTNQDGKFRFVALPWWGRYTVIATDEDAGYSQFSNGPSGRK